MSLDVGTAERSADIPILRKAGCITTQLRVTSQENFTSQTDLF
jgi:hypothetical protein